MRGATGDMRNVIGVCRREGRFAVDSSRQGHRRLLRVVVLALVLVGVGGFPEVGRW